MQSWIKEHKPELASEPVLSAAAPFKTGFAGADDYTDIPPGKLSVRSAGDLYLYPNLIAAVRVDGATLKAWLEHSAERFRRIDPASSEPQALIDARHPGFNFDVIQGGIEYTVDVTQPAGQRIAKLTYAGRAVDPAQHFIVATNNYRAADTGMVGTAAEVVYEGERNNRALVLDWLRAHGQLDARAIPARSWHFAPLPVAVHVTYAAPRGRANEAKAAGIAVTELHDTGAGMASYAVGR